MTLRNSRRILVSTCLALSLLSLTVIVMETTTAAGNDAVLASTSVANTKIEPSLRPTLLHVFQQPQQTEKTIGEVQKNIKVLNAFPQSQLIPMMNLMSASLGVRCNYCHVNNAGQWDYPSDDKPEKNTAREMIAMTLNINKTTFKGNLQVSCFTCHRGRTQPNGVPALPLPEPQRGERGPGGAAGQGAGGGQGAPAATQPTAEDILNKYLTALGGQAAIDKLKTRVMRGSYAGANGMVATYEVEQAAPDKFHVTFTTQQGTMERGFNGSAGWEKNPRGVMDFSGEQLADFKRAFGLFGDLKLKEQFTRMNVRKDKLDGRDVYVIVATTADRKRERLYFDAETGLLLRRATAIQTSIGVIPEEVSFEDYRDVDGVKVPFTIRVTTIDAGSTYTRKYTEIKVNVPVDDSKFNKPQSAPSQPKP